MNNAKLETLINEANILLGVAEETMNKPKGAVVAVSVCQNLKLSMDKLLEAYLRKHMQEIHAEDSLMNKLAQCQIFNQNFKNIDLSHFDCLDEHECNMQAYCLTLDKIQSCLSSAKQIQQLFYHEE